MKSLSTLIDLKQRDLDEKRRMLVQLEEEMDKLEVNAKVLRDELQREANIAAEQPEMARYFGEFAKGNEMKQETLRENKKTLSKLIEAQRDAITGAFAELEQLEIAKEMKDEEEAATLKRKEDAELDEIGLRGFTAD